ncbi:hypothetical protein HDU97_004183 [Phlyctochytrium planicorne]|nr:hypothetical protein HDU97_004183 [Phlyctochytrium planicorne]
MERTRRIERWKSQQGSEFGEYEPFSSCFENPYRIPKCRTPTTPLPGREVLPTTDPAFKLRENVLQHLGTLKFLELDHLYRSVVIVLFGPSQDVGLSLFNNPDFWSVEQRASLGLEKAFIDALYLGAKKYQRQHNKVECNCLADLCQVSQDPRSPTPSEAETVSPSIRAASMRSASSWWPLFSRKRTFSETMMQIAEGIIVAKKVSFLDENQRRRQLLHQMELRGTHDALKSTLATNSPLGCKVLMHFLGVHLPVEENPSTNQHFVPTNEQILQVYFPGFATATDSEKEIIRIISDGGFDGTFSSDLRRVGPFELITKCLRMETMHSARILYNCMFEETSLPSPEFPGTRIYTKVPPVIPLACKHSLIHEAARNATTPHALEFLRNEMSISLASFDQYALTVAAEFGTPAIIKYLGSEVPEIKIQANNHLAFRMAVKSMDLSRIEAVVQCYKRMRSVCRDDNEMQSLHINPMANDGQAFQTMCNAEEENRDISALIIDLATTYHEAFPTSDYPPSPPGPGYDWRGEAIIGCCVKGYLWTLQKLLEAPWAESVGLLPSTGRNVGLRYACSHGKTDIVKYLLETGKVDSRGDDGYCLIYASRYGYSEIVDLLLTHKESKIYGLLQSRQPAPYYFAVAAQHAVTFSLSPVIQVFHKLGLHDDPMLAPIFKQCQYVDGKWERIQVPDELKAANKKRSFWMGGAAPCFNLKSLLISYMEETYFAGTFFLAPSPPPPEPVEDSYSIASAMTSEPILTALDSRDSEATLMAQPSESPVSGQHDEETAEDGEDEYYDFPSDAYTFKEGPLFDDASSHDSLDHSSDHGIATQQSSSSIPFSDLTKEGTEGKEVRMDLISQLPDELSIKCLSFGLGPKALSRCSKVSRRWHLLATDDSLWKVQCRKRWAGKKHCPYRLHPSVDYTTLLDLLSVREMKEILTSRKVDLKGVTEKSEIKDLVRTTTPKKAPVQTNILWPSKWKASFIVAELDSKRIELTKEELCSLNWTFKMLYSDWPEDHVVKAKFNRDYSYESDMLFGDRKMSWRFYLKDVQVEQYPPLKVYRTNDWGYILTNNYAIFHSLEEPKTA